MDCHPLIHMSKSSPKKATNNSNIILLNWKLLERTETYYKTEATNNFFKNHLLTGNYWK
jgi:hypothetical protein